MVRVLIQVALASAGALSTASLTAIQVDQWHPRTDRPVIAALAVIGVLAVATPSRQAVRTYREIRSEGFREGARAALGSVLIRLVAFPDINIRDVGLSAFIVQRRIRYPWASYLKRCSQVRLSNLPVDLHRLDEGQGALGAVLGD